MKKFLDAYGKDMEFCQIELNYFDYRFQDAKGKVELLNSLNIPIWVMEPVRGGQLASLSEDAESKLSSLRPDEKIPAWSFRFLQSIEGVTMTLSGMSTLSQAKENIATYEEHKPLTVEEMNVILKIADDMIDKTTVPWSCVGCRSCEEVCPQNIKRPDELTRFSANMGH